MKVVLNRCIAAVVALALLTLSTGCGSTGSVSNGSPTSTVTAQVSATSLNFGSVNVGSSATQTVTVTSTGTSTLTINQPTFSNAAFSVTGATFPVSIAAGASQTFTIQFSPTSGGPFNASASVPSNASNSPAVLSLTGTGVVPNLTASPASVSFGNVMVGANSAQNVVISNSGSSTVTISSATATGSGFSVSGPAMPASVLANSSQTFTVTFAPTARGAANGNIAFQTSASSGALNVPLSGTGTVNTASVSPTSINFGSVATGSTSTKSAVVSNTGDVSVTVSAANVTGTGYSVSGPSLPATIAVGSSATFNVTFSPQATGTASGSLSFVSSASNSPATVSLTGSGTAQTQLLNVSPTSIAYGTVAIGATANQSVTLSNTGTGSVTISAASVTGSAYSVSGLVLPFTLSAGGTQAATISFAPTASGSASGSVSFVSNATNSPANVTLSGSGGAVGAHTVSLTWVASPTANVNYKVYRGTASGGPYTVLTSSPVSGTSYTDSNGVVSGLTYYYVVTAVDGTGSESTYSNQATAVIPNP